MKVTLPCISTLLLLAQGIHCLDQRTEVRVRVDVDNEIADNEKLDAPFSRFIRDTKGILSHFRKEVRSEHERRVRTRHQALRKINTLEEEIKRRWNHAKRHPHNHRRDKWENEMNNILRVVEKVRRMIKEL